MFESDIEKLEAFLSAEGRAGELVPGRIANGVMIFALRSDARNYHPTGSAPHGVRPIRTYTPGDGPCRWAGWNVVAS